MNRRTKLYFQKMAILLGVYLFLRFFLPLILPFFLSFLTVQALTLLQNRIPVRLTLLAAGYIALFLLLAASGILCGCFLLYEPCRSLLPLCQDYWQEISLCLSWIPDSVSGRLFEKMPSILSCMFGVFLYLISIFLFARDWEPFLLLLKKLPFSEPVSCAGKRIARSARSWAGAQCKIMWIVILECAAGYYLLQIPCFWLWAPLTGFLDALPVFGAGTVFVPWILIKLLWANYEQALWIGLLYLAVWLTRELLEPRLLGNGLGLLPVGFLISVVAGLQLFGVLGLFLGPFGVLLVKELWAELEKTAPSGSSWASSSGDEERTS